MKEVETKERVVAVKESESWKERSCLVREMSLGEVAQPLVAVA